MTFLEIENCAARCSIQDSGRFGWRRDGFPRSGALDLLALAAANSLVGNQQCSAGIELLVGGITVRAVGSPVRLALAGAEFPMTLDGERVQRHASFLMHPGQRLTIGSARRGVCGILAIEGGIDIPAVLGSRSLHARSEIGGYDGRFLRPGDRLNVREADALREEVYLPALPLPPERCLRVVLGPQADFFSPQVIQTLLESGFSVTADCDRMAYRLAGPAIRPRRQANLVSDGVFEGAIQITNAGQPIVMLADHQTIGGYPKMGAVITPDIRLLANALPGQVVTFASISIQAAQVELRRALSEHAALPSRIRPWKVGTDAFSYLSAELIADNSVNGIDEATWAWSPTHGSP